MHHNHPHHPPRKTTGPLHRLLHWATPRWRAAAGLMLRGACYGLGTGAAGLLTFWIQQQL